ncbi:MAG: phosphate ABC transporter substrate-binding protein [Bryobacteraceae bacterium]
MKHTMIFFVATVLVLFAAVALQAADVKVIANPSVGAASVSADELKRVFLLQKNSLDDGSHVEPVVAKGGATHEAFLRDYLSKTDAALQTYYRSLVFTGKASMPKTLGSEAEVAAFVAKTKGAIGYVGAGTPTPGTKTLEVK